MFFGVGDKVGFTNCVFEKLCSSENNIFIVFSENTLVAIKKAVCWKNRKLMKKCGVFLNMAKWCFWFILFEVFMPLWLVLCVWSSCKSVKSAWFPQFVLAFVGGWLNLVFLGLEGLGVFLVLVCVCCSFDRVLLLFVLALFWFCCWIVVGVVLVFSCVFLFCFFFGGGRGGGCFFWRV